MTLSQAPALPLDRARLQAAFGKAAGHARRCGRPVLVSVSLQASQIGPLAAFASALGAETRAFWSSPEGHLSLTGIDRAWSANGTPAQVSAAWQRLTASVLIDAPDAPEHVEPMLLAGFAFDPARPTTPVWEGYPAGLAFLPRLLVASSGGRTALRANAVIEPDSAVDREVARTLDLVARLHSGAPFDSEDAEAPRIEELMTAERWQAIVAGTVRDLGTLGLEKVVLARATHLQRRAPFATAPILRHLRAQYPSCFVFAFARGARCFLGASPEQLVSLTSNRITAVSLAGSIGRGCDEEEDGRLAAALRASAKDRQEHNIVVRAMHENLARAGARDIASDAPAVLKLPNVQHLQTCLTAQPAPGTSVLDLVAHLHPTPAVGGYPSGRALALIREREQLDRGWYAGPIGWVGASGEGEFAVALRSALIHGSEALLFAGCGIVPGSDPMAEYAESCLKLRPMLAALGAGAAGRKGAE
jgi:salicylate biosynthesis isochorismate synthase